MVGRQNDAEHDRDRRAEANEHVAGRIDLARIVAIETARRRIQFRSEVRSRLNQSIDSPPLAWRRPERTL